MVSFTSLQHFVQHDLESSASPSSLSAGMSTTLSMYCSWCASAVIWTVCGVDTCFCTATGFFGRSSPSSVSTQRLLAILAMSCTCGTSPVFFRVLKLVVIAVVGKHRSDRLFLRGTDVSEARLVLASHVLYGGMRDLVLQCLAAKLMIWTLFAAEASGCFCREFIVALDLPCSHPLWVRSFHPLWVRSFHFFSLWCSSKLLGLLVVFDCLSRRARRCRWRTVRLLPRGSLD